MPSGKVPVYCHMSGNGLGACGGGGWTLVMKTDGNKVSNNNRLFAVCRNMDINIILIRRFERMAKMYFVPPRVLTRYQSDIVFSCQNDWKVLTKTMKLSKECSQNSFVKANFRQIGRNGNGVTCCNFPTRLLFIYLFIFLLSQRFTSSPNCGATRATSTLQEERLCLTIMRPSYQPTGTHPSPRSVLVWRSNITQNSLSSPSPPTPCTH